MVPKNWGAPCFRRPPPPPPLIHPCRELFQITILSLLHSFQTQATQLQIKLQLSDGIKNAFEHFEVHIPFFHRYEFCDYKFAKFMTFLHVYCGVPYFGLKKQTIKTLSFLYFIAVDLFSNWIT